MAGQDQTFSENWTAPLLYGPDSHYTMWMRPPGFIAVNKWRDVESREVKTEECNINPRYDE